MKPQKSFHPHILLMILLGIAASVPCGCDLESDASTDFSGTRRQTCGFTGDLPAFACKLGVEPRKKPFHPLISFRMCSERLVGQV